MALGVEQITPLITSGLQKTLFWTVYGILIVIVCAALYFFYYSTQFKIKMYYWQIYGNAQEGFTIDKLKKIKLKFNKERTAWNIFLKKKSIEPFAANYMYPGNTCYAFKFGESFIPAKININKELKNIIPVPSHVKNSHFLELQENEIEFSKKDFWTQNKTLLVTLIVAAFCCGLCALTVYYCLKTASGTASDINQVANALKGLKAFAGVPG